MYKLNALLIKFMSNRRRAKVLYRYLHNSFVKIIYQYYINQNPADINASV